MKKLWRSLEDKNNLPESNAFKLNEFPYGHEPGYKDDLSRRTFMKFMGGVTALAGISGCNIRKPYVPIRPYARKEPHVVPGRSLYYATSHQINGDVVGLLVESQEGRPIKVCLLYTSPSPRDRG